MALALSLASTALVFASTASAGLPTVVAASKGKHQKGTQVTVEAKFDKYVTGAAGKIRGLRLADGAVVRVRPNWVKDTKLKAGDVLKIEGRKVSNAKGTFYLGAKVTKKGVVVVEPTKKHARHAGHAARG